MQRIQLLPVLALITLLACQPDGIVPNSGAGLPPIDSLTALPTEVGMVLGAPVTKTIGPAGGTLTTPDGKITLTFPAGAVSKETAITVQTGENKAPNGVGFGIKVSPAGLAFEQPVTLAYTYQDQEVAAGSVEALGVAFQDGRNAWLMTRLATADKARKTVTTKLKKGAWWALITQYKLNPEETAVNVNETLELKLSKVADEATFAKENSDLLAPLTPYYTDAGKDVAKLYLNGVDWTTATPKDRTFGTVSQNRQTGQILYVAPSGKPATNPVMVTVELKNPGGKAVFLLSSLVTIAKGDYLTINGHAFDTNISTLGGLVNGQVVILASGANAAGKDGTLQVTINDISVGSHAFSPDYQHGTSISAMDFSATNLEAGGESYYANCQKALTESGTVEVLSAEVVNGYTKLVLRVSGSIVTEHDYNPQTCTTTLHKTMSVQAGLTVLIKK